MTGLTPSLWRTLPRELLHFIPEALEDILWNEQDKRVITQAAQTCHSWWIILRGLLFHLPFLQTTARIHSLEQLISSPRSTWIKDHIKRHLSLILDHSTGADNFFAAWQSLSIHLEPVSDLVISGTGYLKSFSIRLRPCPRPLLHLESLTLHTVAFPSFSVLFRTIGALPALQRLDMWRVRWSAVCDPAVPPSATAAFRNIYVVSAKECTEHWPFVWIFTMPSLRLGRPRRALETGEPQRARSARVDACAIVQALRWMCGRMERDSNIELQNEISPKSKGRKSSAIKCVCRG